MLRSLVPSVKGILLLGPVAAVRKAIRKGKLTTEQVEHAPEEPDLIYLKEKVQPTSWYPVEIMGRYLELQASLESGPRDEVLYEFGIQALYYTPIHPDPPNTPKAGTATSNSMS